MGRQHDCIRLSAVAALPTGTAAADGALNLVSTIGGGDCVDDVTWPSTGQGVNSGCPPVGDCYYWRETSWSTSGTNHCKTNFQTSDSRDSGNSATHTKLIPRARYAWKVAPVNSAVDACSASPQ